MKENIQNYIGSLNFNYRVQLRDKKVEYINAFGEFIDQHRLKVISHFKFKNNFIFFTNFYSSCLIKMEKQKK